YGTAVARADSPRASVLSSALDQTAAGVGLRWRHLWEFLGLSRGGAHGGVSGMRIYSESHRNAHQERRPDCAVYRFHRGGCAVSICPGHAGWRVWHLLPVCFIERLAGRLLLPSYFPCSAFS